MFDFPIVNYSDLDYTNIVFDKKNNRLLYTYNKNTSNERIDDLYVLFDYEFFFLHLFNDKQIEFKLINNDFCDKINELAQPEVINNDDKDCFCRLSFTLNKFSDITLHPSKKSGLPIFTSNNFDDVKVNIDKYFCDKIYYKKNNIIHGKFLVKLNVFIHSYNSYDHSANIQSANQKVSSRFVHFNIINCDIKYAASFVRYDLNKNIIYKKNNIDEIVI
jgi:hypothetical protein